MNTVPYSSQFSTAAAVRATSRSDSSACSRQTRLSALPLTGISLPAPDISLPAACLDLLSFSPPPAHLCHKFPYLCIDFSPSPALKYNGIGVCLDRHPSYPNGGTAHERSQIPKETAYLLLLHCPAGSYGVQFLYRAAYRQAADQGSGLRHLYVHDRKGRDRQGGDRKQPDPFHR